MVVTRKTRRHDGRVFPGFKGRKEELFEQGLDPEVYWDDWEDYRDGFRNPKDRKKIRKIYGSFAKYFDIRRWNKKLKLLILRRKAKRKKLMLKDKSS